MKHFWQSLFFRALFVCMIAGFASSILAVEFSPKHIYILNPGTDRLWGSYIVGVEPIGEADKFAPLLPINKIDFRAGRGTDPKALVQDVDGSLQLSVGPSAQTQVFTLDFFVGAVGGGAKFELHPKYDLTELVFLVPTETPLTLFDREKRVKKKDSVDFIGRKYIQYVVPDLKSGENLTVSVSGIKVGRTPLWWIGFFSALLLLGVALVVAMRRCKTT